MKKPNIQENSIVIEACQVCDNKNLVPFLFLGYMPPVNATHPVGQKLHEQQSYPAQLLYCENCNLVQLGIIVDPKILFPPDYPYTSSTTKILRDNFAELYRESKTIANPGKNDLIVDIGSNDGNLLSNFRDSHRVLGVTPEQIGKLAVERGIPTIIDFFRKEVVDEILKKYGKAKIITATNVFAHIKDVNEIVELILNLLNEDGIFISESHYLARLVETLQYDTVYHEHLRYYSLHSLKYLLEKHGLEIIHAKEIPTHGGSIRVYAAKKGKYAVKGTVADILKKEEDLIIHKQNLFDFRDKVVLSKLGLHSLLLGIKKSGKRIYGIGSPSRASTLINYVGIDDGIMDCVVEIEGSHKIGKYIPGTMIPVVDESKLYEEQPEYALLLSWHIAGEITANVRRKGFKGDFIIPLPHPRI